MAAVAAIGVAVIGTGASIAQQRKAQRAQEKADAVTQAQAAIENQRNIRLAIAAGNLQKAQLANAGGTQFGFGNSSSVTGALGAARTQNASNVGFAQQTAAAGSAVNRQTSIANNALSAASTFQSIANIPGQFGFDVKSSANTLAKRFKQPKSVTA